jgi:hypothetical protein
MKMEITFTSGTQLVVDVDEYTVRRSSVTGELTGLDWTTSVAAARKLSYVRLADVVAVVRIAEPGDLELAKSVDTDVATEMTS